MSGDPRSFNTPDLQSLSASDFDQLGRAILSLTKELSIVSDRLLVLEDVLAQNNIIAPDTVDRHCPSEAGQEKIDGARGVILDSVVEALTSE